MDAKRLQSIHENYLRAMKAALYIEKSHFAIFLGNIINQFPRRKSYLREKLQK
jgi:hypothetical protein